MCRVLCACVKCEKEKYIRIEVLLGSAVANEGTSREMQPDRSEHLPATGCALQAAVYSACSGETRPGQLACEPPSEPESAVELHQDLLKRRKLPLKRVNVQAHCVTCCLSLLLA